MRFIDANIFGHAFMKSRRRLSPTETKVKESAKKIILSLEKGERMSTTTVHISEVLNILEDNLGIEHATAFLTWVIATPNLVVYPVRIEDYELAMTTKHIHPIGLNDSLAIHYMKREKILEIYSMDRHFDGLEYIERVTEPTKATLNPS